MWRGRELCWVFFLFCSPVEVWFSFLFFFCCCCCFSAFVRSVLPPEGKKENCSYLLPQDRFNKTTTKISSFFSSSSCLFAFQTAACVERLFAQLMSESIGFIKIKKKTRIWRRGSCYRRALTFLARQGRYYLISKNALLNRVTFLDFTDPPFNLYSVCNLLLSGLAKGSQSSLLDHLGAFQLCYFVHSDLLSRNITQPSCHGWPDIFRWSEELMKMYHYVTEKGLFVKVQ